MRVSATVRFGVAVLGLAGMVSFALPAQAHYCDCLWVSRYNVVIRPDTDPVPLSGGAANFSVRVQNNMGYPLVNFELHPYIATGSVSVSGHDDGAIQKSSVSRGGDSRFYLLPGESIRYYLQVSGASGSSLGVDKIEFFVRFANPNNQDHAYGNNDSEGDTSSPPGTAAVIRKASGIVPASPSISDPGSGSQARNIMDTALADFGSSGTTGLNALFDEYCAGRKSWASDSYRSPLTNCTGSNSCCAESSGAPATFNWPSHCSGGAASGGTDKYQWQHLWAASMLAGRKNQIASQLPILRKRLQCGFNDSDNAFKGMAGFVLGYLGADSDVQSFFLGSGSYSTNWTTTGSSASQCIAKSAVFMLTSGSQFSTDVNTCLSNGDAYAEMVAAGALRYVNGSSADGTVDTELISRVNWGPGADDAPEGNTTTANGWFAAHILDILAWDQRGYARLAADSGSVSFYSVVVDTTPPKAPANIRCSTLGTATSPYLRVSWDAVTQDTSNATEKMGNYTLYRGSAARDTGCNAPADSACHFTNNNSTTATYIEPSGLTAGATYYFTVRATDSAGNNSAWSTPSTFSCVAPTPAHAPVAVLHCTPTSASSVPATVSCDCAASTDADGNGTITHCYYSLDGAAEQEGTGTPGIGSNAVSYTFNSAGSHTVTLRVTDNTAGTPLTDTDQVTLSISAGSNQPPVAAITPHSTNCSPGDTVDFDASTSHDDGTIATYAWSFSDDSSTATGVTASHQFDTPGSYTATLTVTDDGGLTGTDVANVTVVGNAPPLLDDATVSPVTVHTNSDVTCDATGVYDPDDSTATPDNGIAIAWDFGDSNTASTATATHQYAAEGTYTVSLTATDSGTPPATSPARTWQVTVSNSINLPPACANATVAPTSGDPPLTVSMNATACTDPESTTVSYLWTVRTASGASTTYTTLTAQHVFTEGGTHDVSFVATDSGSPQMSSAPQHFAITVTGAGPGVGSDAMVAVCGCADSSGSERSLAALLFVLGFGLSRRRRR